MQPALRRLEELAALPADWDSYGSAPLSPEAVTGARALLVAVDKQFGGELGEKVRPYAIAPVADGSIQLEWRSVHAETEVDIDAAGRLGYLFVDKQGPNRTFAENDNPSWADVIDTIGKVLFPAA